MRKIFIALMLVTLTASASAKAPKPKEPAAPAITHAGDICKTIGGFGRVFGRGYGHVDALAGEDWAPFEKLAIEPGRITAEASFRGVTDTLEGDVEAAEKFLKSLDRAVQAKHHFKHRETSGGAVRFSSGKDVGSGVVLMLEQEQDLIRAVCSGG
jgi:hypothetical protein